VSSRHIFLGLARIQFLEGTFLRRNRFWLCYEIGGLGFWSLRCIVWKMLLTMTPDPGTICYKFFCFWSKLVRRILSNTSLMSLAWVFLLIQQLIYGPSTDWCNGSPHYITLTILHILVLTLESCRATNMMLLMLTTHLLLSSPRCDWAPILTPISHNQLKLLSPLWLLATRDPSSSLDAPCHLNCCRDWP